MEQNFLQKWDSFFKQYRPFLISFAFRMTGSLSEAEDIVQDTFIECSKIDPITIDNHKSWLTKVCSNKGLDHLKLAYKKREAYVGPWLPDAIPESFQLWESLEAANLPEKNILLAESLTTTFLLLVEKLTPEERVVYLLNEVFEYSFQEIADFLKKTDAACRKIAERARKSVLENKPKFTNTENAEKLIAQFFDLAKQGDINAMISMLADGSEFWSDGGGKVSASRVVLNDLTVIAKFFKMVGSAPAFTSPDYHAEFKHVNMLPGLVVSKKLPSGQWDFETIFSFEMKDGKIARIYAQRNPDKFKALV